MDPPRRASALIRAWCCALLTAVLALLPARAGAYDPPARGAARLGYSASFQGGVSVAGIRAGRVNMSAPGWRDLSHNLTLSVWRRADLTQERPGTPLRLVDCLGNTVLDLTWLYLKLSTGDKLFYNFDTTDYLAWFHQVFVFDGNAGTVRVFENGGIPFEYENRFELPNCDMTLYMGATLDMTVPLSRPVYSKTQERYKGELDDLRLYSRALSDAEALALFSGASVAAAQGAPPADLVLHYSFDALCSGSPGDPRGLLAPECGASGDGVVRNLGVAGPDYDLLLGQLNDEQGNGLGYAEFELSEEHVTPFSRPGTKPSDVAPFAAFAAARAFPVLPATPLVFRVSARAEDSVAMPLPANASGPLRLASLPVWGSVSRGSNGDALLAGALLTGEAWLNFSAPVAPAGNGTAPVPVPAWFSVLDAATGLEQQYHVWPDAPPHFPAVVELRTLENVKQQIDLGTYFVSVSGEAVDVELLTLPGAGSLRLKTHSFINKVLDDPQSYIDLGALNASGAILSFWDGLSVDYITPLFAIGEAMAPDEFQIAFLSADRTVRSAPLTVRLLPKWADLLPSCEEGAAALAEDSSKGVWVNLTAADRERNHDLVIVIDSLPANGDLFVVRPGGARELITLDMTRVSIYQYASHILRVSSFVESLGELKGHPLMLLGRPTCPDLSVGEGCTDVRARADASWMPEPGDFIYVFYEPPMELLYMGARVLSKYQDARGVWLVDVQLIPEWKEVAPGLYEPCREIFEEPAVGWPSWSCSTEQAKQDPPGGLVIRRATRDRITFPAGYWSPKSEGLSAEPRLASNIAAVYGTQFLYSWNQSDGYLERAQFEPYTEWFEVGFDEAVYPERVYVGQPEGGGAIVGVKVFDNTTGSWIAMFKGAPQREMFRAARAKKRYFTFDEVACSLPFRTDRVRVELDTSTATGIPGWNYIDYVQLVGSVEFPSSVLRAADAPEVEVGDRLLYVPHADESGADSFSFRTTDCLGDPSRFTATRWFHLSVAPTRDLPVTSSASPDLRCRDGGGAQEVDVSVDVIEMDGEEVRAVVLVPTSTGTVVLGATVELAPPARPRGARRFRVPASISLDCALLEAHATVTELAATILVTDSAGDASEQKIRVRVLHHDKLLVSSVIRVGCSAMFLVLLASCLASLLWIVVRRDSLVVRLSQAPFLALLVVGVLVSSAVIPLNLIDDVNYSAKEADASCNAMVILFSFGNMLTFSAIYVKLMRVMRLFDSKFVTALAFGSDKEREWRKRSISNRAMMMQISGVLLVSATLCACAITIAPMHYMRVTLLVDESSGFVLRSAGVCGSKNILPFAALIGAYHFLVYAYVALVCYRTRNVDSALSESKYLAYAIASVLQIMLMCVPMLYMSSDDPDMAVFTRAITIFLTNSVIIALIFGPKMLCRSKLASETSSKTRKSVKQGKGSYAATAQSGVVSEAASDNRVAPAPDEPGAGGIDMAAMIEDFAASSLLSVGSKSRARPGRSSGAGLTGGSPSLGRPTSEAKSSS
jgi:hypothetical protein